MANVQRRVTPGVNAESGRADGVGPGNFSGHPADKHDALVGPIEEGRATLDDANALRDSHGKEFNEFALDRTQLETIKRLTFF